MSSPAADHVPVMLAEMLAAIAPCDGGAYVDATFGAGGYARAILDAASCRVWGVDRDARAVAAAAALAAASDGRLRMTCAPFGEMDRLLAEAGVDQVDGVAFDLGVSSMQIDDPERGFSFRYDGPLDMRMGPDAAKTAADVVNATGEAELARLIRTLGEERAARRIAGAIVAARAEAPITRTGRLADIIRGVLPRAADGIDPATRTFQALRMHVNDELGELDRGLVAAERLLRPGGRLCVVAFHSLEDRVVKTFLRQRGGAEPRGSRHRPDSSAVARTEPTFRLLHRRALRPSAGEVTANPRARSARLRAAERTAAAPWPASHRPSSAAEPRRSARRGARR